MPTSPLFWPSCRPLTCLSKRVQLSALSPLLIDALRQGQPVVLVVSGDSMRPLLRHQLDRVCLVGTQRRHPGLRDIVLCLLPSGKYLLHRIVGVGPTGYVLLGDSQLVKQPLIRPEQVLGVVQGFWRAGKYLDCDSPGYRVYCWLWAAGYPLRWLGAKAWRALRRVAEAVAELTERELRHWTQRGRSAR